MDPKSLATQVFTLSFEYIPAFFITTDVSLMT